MSFVRAIVTVGGLTAVSRVFGFVRDVMTASLLGAGPIADAFFVAFKFPNFFRRLFAEGAFNAAFVPSFAGLLASDGRLAAIRFAEQSLAVLLAVLVAFTALAELAMPWLMFVLAPGFEDDPLRYGLSVELTRITFPYLLFVSLAALFSGVLNSLDRFAAAAATPILLNLLMMVAILVLPPHVPTAGHALAWGVAAAGVAQFVWLAVSMHRAGVDLHLPWPRLTPQVRRVLKLMVPGAVGAGIVQVNLMIDVVIASLLPAGAVSYLYYADRLNQLPLGVIGAAIGTALLPLLARQIRAGEEAAAQASQNRAAEYALVLTLPAAAGLVMLARPIMSVLFERGEFTAADAMASGDALAAFAIGLPAYVLIKVLTPPFFARGDTATPVKIAVAALAANILLNLVLMQVLAHVGIALATALSAWANAAILALVLRRRRQFETDARLRRRVPALAAASLLMAVLLYGCLGPLAPWLAKGSVLRLPALALLVGAGGAVFLASAQLLGGLDLRELLTTLRRRRTA